MKKYSRGFQFVFVLILFFFTLITIAIYGEQTTLKQSLAASQGNILAQAVPSAVCAGSTTNSCDPNAAPSTSVSTSPQSSIQTASPAVSTSSGISQAPCTPVNYQSRDSRARHHHHHHKHGGKGSNGGNGAISSLIQQLLDLLNQLIALLGGQPLPIGSTPGGTPNPSGSVPESSSTVPNPCPPSSAPSQPSFGPSQSVSNPSAGVSSPPSAASPAISQPATGTIWKPAPNTTWQWQLTGTIDTSVNAAVYDIDWETDASVVQTLHSQGKKVICYISVGSIEDWRPDASSFPAEIIGADYEGWAGEKWLDIRNITKLGPIMAARLDTCKQKGFDAIEPDNMDVPDGNGSGFPLTEADELNYANWLAQEAHNRGMSIGIKNTGSQVGALLPNFDFAVVEECFQYNECDVYNPFIQANKAVFEAEYSLSTSEFCPQANSMKFSSIKKNLNLDAPRTACL